MAQWNQQQNYRGQPPSQAPIGYGQAPAGYNPQPGRSAPGHQQHQGTGYQQPGGYQQAPGHQQPGGYQQAPGHQQPGGYQQGPGHQQPGGYQQGPGHQQPGRYQQAPGHQQQGGAYPPQSGYPPQQGHQQTVPQAPPPGVDAALWGWFQSVDRDRSGGISADELQQALLNNNWSHFNAETCRLMIGMFDKDRSGTIDIYEFAALWKYVQEWKNCFDRFDTDRSGSIDGNELLQAFTSFGYRLSAEFCGLCVRVFDRTSKNSMKFDDFIQCCVMLKSLTDAFKRHDMQQRGVIHISYEQFLEMVLDNQLSGLK